MRELTKGEWISVKDRLPEEGRYLFATKSAGVEVGFISGYAAKYKRPEALVHGKGRQFTHWMKLPAQPED